MKLLLSALLSGLISVCAISSAQAQTTTINPPLTPDSKTTNATSPTDNNSGSKSSQAGRPSAEMAKKTMGTDHMQSKAEADATYADAKRKCQSLSGQERRTCLKQAKQDHQPTKQSTSKSKPASDNR